MQSYLPPIPILILLTLIVAWLVPLAVKNLKKVDFSQQQRTEKQLRSSFYTTFALTVAWLIIYFFEAHQKEGSGQELRLMMVLLGIFATLWRFRVWRYHSKKSVRP